jgi:hypothetical protein
MNELGSAATVNRTIMKRALLAVALLMAACQAERSAPFAAARSEAATDAQAAGSRSPATQSPARVIIRNANLTLVVRDAVDVLQKVTSLVESKGGYVTEVRQWKEREQVRATATLRVPAAELTRTLSALRSLAVRTEAEHMTAQDVTQEYTDLGAQLRNLQAAETELRELLRTVRERTQKASEVMEIYREITNVRGEIERIQGRIQYLSQMSALSTISVELVPDVLAAPVVEPGWQPIATVKAASRALVNAAKSAADLLIWFVIYILPLAVLFFVLALAVRAVWLKVRRLGNRPPPG